jgi:hypothetical protein
MARHFFHCTNGLDLVTDGRGQDADDYNLDLIAQEIAERMVRALPASFDWSAWVVSVHDADGRQVALVPFPTHRRRTQTGAPRRDRHELQARWAQSGIGSAWNNGRSSALSLDERLQLGNCERASRFVLRGP